MSYDPEHTDEWTHQRTAVCPAELILNIFVIESYPLVVLTIGCNAKRIKHVVPMNYVGQTEVFLK